MKDLDANVLLYAVNEDARHHRKAKKRLEVTHSGTEPVGFEWTGLPTFLPLSARTCVFPSLLKIDDALGLTDSWLSPPCAEMVQPGERHFAVLKDLLHPMPAAGKLTSDAHLAAVTIEHGAELCSGDGDYSRSPGLRWTNPVD